MASALKDALDRRGHSQSALRHVPGIDYSYACRHYRGEQEISADYAVRYETSLGIPRSELRPDLWPSEEWETVETVRRRRPAAKDRKAS